MGLYPAAGLLITIREIIATASGPAQAERSPAERERFAHALFESLVNRDFLMLGLRC